MIRDLEAYLERSEEEKWEALRAMTVEESIALGEALRGSVVRPPQVGRPVGKGLSSHL